MIVQKNPMLMRAIAPVPKLHGAVLTSADCRSENVRILAVIVAELELRDIERKVLFTDVMERADYAAFEDRPEAFDCIGMNCTDNVVAARMVDSDVLRKFFVEMLIANPLGAIAESW